NLEPISLNLPNLKYTTLYGEQSQWFAENIKADELRVFEHICGDRDHSLNMETFEKMSNSFKLLEQIIIVNSQNWDIPDEIIEFSFGGFENVFFSMFIGLTFGRYIGYGFYSEMAIEPIKIEKADMLEF
uniref:Uncharacterized protein n=1 Tax=Megaselia scalaris TaxID=36166 RepID=T1GZ12_MEGSC